MRAFAVLACCLLLGACTSIADPQPPVLQRLHADAEGLRLRGISAVDARIAWASGQKGVVLRTGDGGRHWTRVDIAAAAELDLRDIHAFDADTALALAIGPGEASRVYRTADGGRSWTEVARNRNPNGFWDCMAFDRRHGRILGDPVDGHYQLLETRDAGRSWALLTDAPAADPGEAAFAASGSCIARVADAWVVGTGGATARLHLQRDRQAGWRAIDAGMQGGRPSAGVFSVAAHGDGVFAVGGDYSAEQAPGGASRMPDVAGTQALALPAPRGYRSGVACAASGLPCIAVGPSGVDLWDGGRWQPLGDSGFDAIALANGVAWLSGANGALARIVLARPR